MIVTVCADKGSPGVSWTATALTMLWPGERVLLEADPSGGDAALRLRTPDGRLLARQPTLRGLSVDARSGALPSFAAYTHHTSLGMPVIPATDMRTEDFGLIARQWPAVAASANSWRGTVIADIGRLQEDTASGPIAAASTVVLLIARPNTEGLYHLRERAKALTARLGQGMHGQSPLAIAVICPAREHNKEIDNLRAHLAADPATSEIPVAGWIAHDPRAIALMREGQVTKKLTSSDLIRSTGGVVDTLLSWWPKLHGDQPLPDQVAYPPRQPTSPPTITHSDSPQARPVRVPEQPVAPTMNTGRWR